MTIERCACEEAEHYREAMLKVISGLDRGGLRTRLLVVVTNLYADILSNALRDVKPGADSIAEAMVDREAL